MSGDPRGDLALEMVTALLLEARKRGASDLHVAATMPAIVRLHGEIFVLRREPMPPDTSKMLLFSVLSRQQQAQAEKDGEVEMLLARPEGRYRCCFIRQRLGWDGCFHIIPERLPDASEIGLPKPVTDLTLHRNGLILVTGPRGSGKTTSLAALLNVVNNHRADHILAIDDPVEYLIPSVRSMVSQRSVGTHTESFAAALRSALREDPDIISIGELRDTETISLAITAAETGHLVIASLHTGSAVGAIARIIDAFPLDQQPQVRAMLSESLRGAISQRLVPRADGMGRVLALEVMVNTPGVGSLIRDNKLFQIRSVIQTGKKQGMQLLDEHLLKLWKAGTISLESAKFYAEQPERFK